MQRNSVVLGFCYGNTITPEWRRSYNNLLINDLLTTKNIIAEHSAHAGPEGIAEARCKVVKMFLEIEPYAEWLFFTDTDAVFPVTILDTLLKSASKEAPIVGALSFRLVEGDMNPTGAASFVLEPMIYAYRGDDIYTINDYVPDTVLRCSAVSIHAMLIHRSVLEDPRWLEDRHPLPWFRTSVRKGKLISDFHFFCNKAGDFGYPVHVNTAAKTAHVKPIHLDEDLFQKMNRK
jgi:hypothetical protein